MNKRERIEQAVIEHGGVWPGKDIEGYLRHYMGDGEDCTRAEFEHVVGDFERLYKRSRHQKLSFVDWLQSTSCVSANASALLLGKQWRTPLPTEQPKSWHEAGELPPDYEAHKKNTELLFDITKFLVANQIGNPGESCVDVVIRELSEKHGIKSQRERVIEAAHDVFRVDGGDVEEGMQRLYDAGMLKLPEGEW